MRPGVGIVSDLWYWPQDLRPEELPGYLCGERVVPRTNSLQAGSSSLTEAYDFFAEFSK